MPLWHVSRHRSPGRLVQKLLRHRQILSLDSFSEAALNKGEETMCLLFSPLAALQAGHHHRYPRGGRGSFAAWQSVLED
jgi:hypothetical protein